MRKCAAHLRIICAIIRGCLFLDFLVIVPAHLGAYRVHHSCVDITARTGERFRRRQLVIHAVSYAACPNLVTAAERGMYRVQVAHAPRRQEVAEFIDICCHIPARAVCHGGSFGCDEGLLDGACLVGGKRSGVFGVNQFKDVAKSHRLFCPFLDLCVVGIF